MFERFTDGARAVLAFANQEALARKHQTIATHHILLGLLSQSVARAMLVRLGADVEQLRISVEKRIGAGSGGAKRYEVPPTPRAKEVIQFAIDEADELGQRSVGIVHLLLGLLRASDSIAAEVLTNAGGTLDALRKRSQNLLSQEILRAHGAWPENEATDPARWLGNGI
ncbi:MAG: hypothetical protein JSU86_16315 [Phycisphaerales bacterium]|nr:MAG: hypothetical protein JSU86_16315 [Phycisphaerales bacterium]